jgi:signal transduction histidine kinase
MRANLDVLARSPHLSDDERRIMADVTREQHRLLALLDGLQRLARGDASGAVPRERLDLADIVDAAVTNAATRYPDATITFDGPDDVPISGWSDGLRLLIDNLLDNAVRHGRPDVRVAVTLAVRDGAARLFVDDDGPGVPAGERREVFGRFVRGSGARAPGSGLGLALVAQQAAVHGGHVRIDDAPLGGARVVVELATDGQVATNR